MVEIAVAVIDTVIKKFGRMALDQASIVVNFTKDFQWLRDKLTNIADDLKDADSHTIQNARARKWIQQVRLVAWDTEDIIEECAVRSYCRFPLKFRYKMGQRIKDVKQRMTSIIQDARDMEIVHKVIHLDDQPSTSRSETLQQVQKPLSRLDSKSPHVAIEDKVNHIRQLLKNPEFQVTVVVGMEGVVKTFLLQHVYRSCKVHDLLLDLAISICKENNCAVAVQEGCPRNPSADGSSCECRRILLAKKGIDNNVVAKLHCPRFLRTLSFSHNDIKSIPANLFSSVRALGVLDLSHTQISTLPKCFRNLKLLRVLNLSFTQIQEVPECVRNLKSLWFLDLDGCNIERLPDWIGQLTCLLYLDIDARRLPKQTSNLVALRTLIPCALEHSVTEGEFLKLKDVAKLINLQCLSIELQHEVEFRSIEEGVLTHLVNMGRLYIMNVLTMQGADNIPCFPENMKAMKHLEFLYLEKFVVPSAMCEFTSLRVLVLNPCELSDDAALEAMPNLMTLHFQSVNKKEILKVFGKSGGFPKLRFLVIVDCKDLEEFPALEDGAMASLVEVTLTDCKKLQKVTEGLQHFENLKLLELWRSGTNELKERLKQDGNDLEKFKAKNPSLTITVQ